MLNQKFRFGFSIIEKQAEMKEKSTKSNREKRKNQASTLNDFLYKLRFEEFGRDCQHKFSTLENKILYDQKGSQKKEKNHENFLFIADFNEYTFCFV